MSTEKDPFAQPYKIALYKELSSGWTHVSHFYGEDDANYHGDSVRISQPVEVPFEPLSDEKVIEAALKTLDATEQNIRVEFQKKLDALNEQRNRFRALTHQPDVVA